MKFWNLYYWNKHEYCWKWIGIAVGDTAALAIQDAKKCLHEFAKSHMMKVERDYEGICSYRR